MPVPLPWWGRVELDLTTWGPISPPPGQSGPAVGVTRCLGPYLELAPELLPVAARLDRAGFPVWRRSPRDDRLVEMPWPDQPSPEKVWPLDRLAFELKAVPPRPGDPRLAELDRACVRLLEAAALLHGAGLGVGLLSPANVLIALGGPLVLADLGLVTRDPVDFDWLSAGDPFAPLCAPRTPREQHLLTPFAGPGPDLALIARLIARVLLGGRLPAERPTGGLPPLAEAPELAADVWHVLDQALAGGYARAEDFADDLRAHPPSGHFPRAAAGRRRPRGLIAAGVMAALAITGVAATASRLHRPAGEAEAPVVKASGSVYEAERFRAAIAAAAAGELEVAAEFVRDARAAVEAGYREAAGDRRALYRNLRVLGARVAELRPLTPEGPLREDQERCLRRLQPLLERLRD